MIILKNMTYAQLPEYKEGKCDRCYKFSNRLNRFVWLDPKIYYICSHCKNDWKNVFSVVSNQTNVELFKEFIKEPPKFVFR